ncbi:MAG: bestrophin family ion channel [Polyangiaceae bacterium]
MWVQGSSTWLSVVLRFGPRIAPIVYPRVIATTLLASLVTFVHQRYEQFHWSLTVVPFTLLGLPLGIFLGFRNTASYDRFWEGRKLWGALVNTTRTLTRQVLTLVDPSSSHPAEVVRATQERIVRATIAYAHALRMALRSDTSWEKLGEFLPPETIAKLAEERNVPYGISQRIAEQIRDLRVGGCVHPMHAPVFEQSLATLTDIQGGCERIANTPIPFSYAVVIHRIVALYCVLLPLGIADTVAMLTPAVVLFVSYALFTLDAIGDELEDPFGHDVNDLPLHAICVTIETNLRQRLGETTLPPPRAPVRGVLD